MVERDFNHAFFGLMFYLEKYPSIISTSPPLSSKPKTDRIPGFLCLMHILLSLVNKLFQNAVYRSPICCMVTHTLIGQQAPKREFVG